MRKTSLALLVAIVFSAAGCTTVQPAASRPKPPRKSLDLQGIVDKARDGSTATIPFGEYRLAKGLVIKNRKNLTLTCRPGTRILVEDTNADVLSIQGSEGIQIENLYLRHTKPLEEYVCHGAVLRIRDSKNVRITNSELNGCGAVGIYADGCQGLQVRNCFIHHNSWCALVLYRSDEIKIHSNVIQDNALLLQTSDVGFMEIFDNSTSRNGGYVKGHPDPNPGLKQKEPSNH